MLKGNETVEPRPIIEPNPIPAPKPLPRINPFKVHRDFLGNWLDIYSPLGEYGYRIIRIKVNEISKLSEDSRELEETTLTIYYDDNSWVRVESTLEEFDQVVEELGGEKCQMLL